jgi:hypothetical protein
MTELVTALCGVCVLFSIGVFLVDALDAYRTGESRGPEPAPFRKNEPRL